MTPLGLAVAAAMLLGVLALLRMPVLPAAWLMPGLLGAGVWLWWRPPRAQAGWRLLGVLLAGFAWASLHAQAALELRLPPTLEGSDLSLTVTIDGLPEPRPELTRFEARVLDAPEAAAGLRGRRLRLSWYRPAPELAPGEVWVLNLRLRRPRGVLNPGGFDFERWALQRGLAATGYVREPELARRLRPARGLDAWRLRLSERIAGRLAGRDARFIRALALGDTRGFQDRDWEVLRATGLSHLMAISGFHVGMVAGFSALLTRALWWLLPGLGLRWPRPQGAAVAALLAATAYSAAAGFALPTLRTLLMIAVVLVARLGRRAQAPSQSFALALLAVLLFDPLAVLGAGFWLSFLGVAWLLWCLPGAPSGGGAWLRALLSAQGVATLGLLPMTVWFFGQASLLGPLANLIGIPAIALGVAPLAVLGLAGEALWPGLGSWLLHAASWLMDGLWVAMGRAADWPWSQVWLPEAGLAALLLALAGAFWLLLPRGVPGKALAPILFLPLLWPRLERPPPGAFDLRVLDVGQGLSVLVSTAGHHLLYDAGPAYRGGLDLGEAAVLPALQALGVRRLDRLVLSHADNDHAGGAAALRRAHPQAEVLAPEGSGLAPARPCRAGQSWEWDGVRFALLHPPEHFPYLRNESSCVLRIEAAGRAVLLPGDIGSIVERRLAREQSAALAAEVLLAPHHGSRGSSSPELLDAVGARRVLVSSGHRNRFGHPHPQTLARYRERGMEAAGTGESGMLALRVGPEGLSPLRHWREERRRFWHED